MAKIVLQSGETVAEVYEIDFIELMRLALKNTYYKESYKFYCNVMHRYPDELSLKQRSWLLRLRQRMRRERSYEEMK